MPLTKLDTTPALVVSDLQKGIVGLPTVHPAGEIIGRAAQLARAFQYPIAKIVGSGLPDGDLWGLACVALAFGEWQARIRHGGSLAELPGFVQHNVLLPARKRKATPWPFISAIPESSQQEDSSS